METVFIFFGGCVIGGLAAWLFAQRQIRAHEMASMQWRTQLEAEQKHAQVQLELVRETEEKLAQSFKALSAEALRSNNEEFLRLAKANLETVQERASGELARRHQAFGELVAPISDSLAKVSQKINEFEQKRTSAEASLIGQMQLLADGNSRLNKETGNLVRALRNPTVRGRWGEMQLRRVVELAGMVEHCDFIEQVSVESDSGRLRPDMIIKLPGDKSIVVDSKAPSQAYFEAIESQDDAGRRQKLVEHARQMRNHFNQLAGKSYWSQFPSAPDYVVLFLSGELYFNAALEHDASLYEDALAKRVLIATPITLLALLHSAAYGWRQERIAENAQEISELGRRLFERLQTMAEHFSDLRRGLDSAVKSYNNAIGSFESRVLVTARKFQELGAASDKPMPRLEVIDTATRSVTPSEEPLIEPMLESGHS